MKNRVSLTLKPETIAKLKAGRRHTRTSRSAAVDDAVEARNVAHADGPSPFAKWAGKFADWFTEEDFQADDRIGDGLRNTEAYEIMKRAKRRKSA